MVVLTGCWVHWPALCTVSRGSPTSPWMFVSASPVLSHTHLDCENPAYHSSILLSKKKQNKKNTHGMIYELRFVLSDKANNPVLPLLQIWNFVRSSDSVLDEWATVWTEGQAECQPSVKEKIFCFQPKGARHEHYQQNEHMKGCESAHMYEHTHTHTRKWLTGK